MDLAMKRAVWGGFGFTPWNWAGQPGFWEMLRGKTLDLKSKTDKSILLGVGCNLFEWGTFLRRMDNFLMDLFLNLVQINARNMEPLKLKKEFGKGITFWGGGADTRNILNNATSQEVKDHVIHNLQIFTKGGGFIFSTVYNIMPDVPLQNIVGMFEAVHEFY
jgi:hypothetical protein